MLRIAVQHGAAPSPLPLLCPLLSGEPLPRSGWMAPCPACPQHSSGASSQRLPRGLPALAAPETQRSHVPTCSVTGAACPPRLQTARHRGELPHSTTTSRGAANRKVHGPLPLKQGGIRARTAWNYEQNQNPKEGQTQRPAVLLPTALPRDWEGLGACFESPGEARIVLGAHS